MRTLRALIVITTALMPAALLSACGADASSVGADAGEALPFDFVTPGVTNVTPSAMALGDKVQIFGDGFLLNEYGTSILHLSGVYTDSTGQAHNYDGDVMLDVKNVSVASFIFEELIFLPSADKTGTFVGTASVTSILADHYRTDDIQSELSSTDIDVTMEVEPSLGIIQLRSVSESGCSPVTKGTVGDQQLALTMQAIGLEDATTENPITYRVTFLSPTMRVTYVKDDAYDLWPIPSLQPAFAADASEGEGHFDFVVTEGNQLVIDPTYRKDRVTVSPPVTMGGETFSSGLLLQRFSTGATDGRSTISTILVEAIPQAGESISRIISYDINEAWEIQSYDQNVRLMERSDAVPVSGCFPGGDVGRDLAYSEGSSLTQSRSLSFRWDRNIANTLGVSAGVGGLLPVQVSVNASATFSETFGIDINETVSSETHVGINFSARIIPGFFGTCYRQVDKLQREVDVIYTNACGRSGIIGQTLLTDWNFGFDIATGESCDTPSSLDDGGNYEPDGIQL